MAGHHGNEWVLHASVAAVEQGDSGFGSSWTRFQPWRSGHISSANKLHGRGDMRDCVVTKLIPGVAVLIRARLANFITLSSY
jgi:hypothetical protein